MNGATMRRFAAGLGSLTTAMTWVVLSMSWAAPTAAEELMLTSRGIDGSDLVVDVVARDLRAAGSLDLTVGFDASKLGAPRVEHGPLTRGGMVADNLTSAGSYRIAVISPTGVSGDGGIVTLRFPVQASAGSAALGLEARVSDVNGVAIPSRALGTSVTLGDAWADASEDSDAPEAMESDDRSYETAAVESDSADRDSVDPNSGDSSRVDSEPIEPEFLDPSWEEEEERRRVDREARLAGYAMQLRFDPRERLAEDSGSTTVRAWIGVFKHGDYVDVTPQDVDLDGLNLDIRRVRPAEDGRGLELELAVDADALPAWIQMNAFNMNEWHMVPVYPRVDVDVDGSGDLTRLDYALFATHIGKREGQAGYDERLDILPDGKIDEYDAAAFRFNLREAERARRLETLRSNNPEEVVAP
jgi:hypothetical protein